MERRGFLGRLAVLVVAPAAVAKAAPKLRAQIFGGPVTVTDMYRSMPRANGRIADISDPFTDALRRTYPAGAFRESLPIFKDRSRT